MQFKRLPIALTNLAKHFSVFESEQPFQFSSPQTCSVGSVDKMILEQNTAVQEHWKLFQLILLNSIRES